MQRSAPLRAGLEPQAERPGGDAAVRHRNGRLRARSSPRVDIVFVGFVLGHGGDALQMLWLAHGLQRRGATVKIVVPRSAGTITFEQRCAALGIECERTPLITADMNAGRQRLVSVVRLLRSLDATVVHFHTGNSCLPRKVMLALELLRFRRSFVTSHSPYETVDPDGSRARFWAATARRRFLAVVSPSDHATRFQRRCGLGHELTLTVRNTVGLPGDGTDDPGAPRARLGVDATTPVVLFCSRIDKQKRPLDAVRAFAGVADEFPTAVLAFAGVGDLSEDVLAEATRLGVADRVRMVGYQTNVGDWLAAATVWLLPTERENFSVAVLEALAAGCPVLSTTCPGNDEVLVDGVNAVTFAVGDVDAASAGLRRLLGDAALREHVAEGGRASATRYTLDAMVDGYLDVYARSGLLPRVIGR